MLGSTVSALILCLGFVPNASAATISGSYDYAITGETSNAGCSAYGGNPWTDNFHSTSGGNSIASDPVSFSICDGNPGVLDGGLFLVTDSAGDYFNGTFTGLLTGISGGGGDIFDGSYIITTTAGYYSSLTVLSGALEVVTGQVNTPAFVTGTFDFQSAPEPVPAALAGSGLILLGLSRKLLKRRA
jgi:hypothetical protein